MPSPTITSAPSASVNCGNTSPEDSADGLCTCSAGSLISTTFTPSGGPGNDCGASTIILPGARNFGGSLGGIPASVACQEQERSGVFTTTLAVSDAPSAGAESFGGSAGQIPNSVASAEGSSFTIFQCAQPTRRMLVRHW